MATPRLRCNLCEQPLAAHCPETNYTCTWLRCTNSSCTAELYDWRNGTLRHTDGTIETWDQQPASDQPPAVTVHDHTDACRHCGRPPEADGDHTCPCPHHDDTCPEHGRPPAPDA